MTPTIPPRPDTPALDALWKAHGIGASRYTKVTPPGIGWTDGGLELYRLGRLTGKDVLQRPILLDDLEAVPLEQASAAQQWLDAVMDVAKANGGFLPGEGPNETPIPPNTTSNVPPITTSTVPPSITSTVPPMTTPSALGPPTFAGPPLTVGTVVTPEHHEQAADLASKGRDAIRVVAENATPENVSTVVSLLGAFMSLFGHRRHQE